MQILLPSQQRALLQMISMFNDVRYTFKPCRASRMAATSPLCPAPTIATSAFFTSVLKLLNPFRQAFRHAVEAFSSCLDMSSDRCNYFSPKTSE